MYARTRFVYVHMRILLQRKHGLIECRAGARWLGMARNESSSESSSLLTESQSEKINSNFDEVMMM